MRKFLLLIVVFLSVSLFAKAQTTPNSLFITGKTIGVANGKVYLQKFVNKAYQKVDSANIVNGSFQLSPKDIELPELYSLTLDPTRGSLMVFLEKGKIEVQLDSATYYRNSVAKGSKLQDLFQEYRKSEEEVKIDEFIKAHPSSLVAMYALYRDFSYRLTVQEIKDNLKLLDPSLMNTQYAKVLNELIKTMENVSSGKKAPDFTITDKDGKTVKLSDFTGKGYLLLDFWASWCGPCRRENPNVVKAYQLYKDKGFDVLGVSLDRNKASWLAAIEKDGLIWHQTSDLKFWSSEPAKLYGVRAIPSNFLLDKNGIIVGKDLREEELLNTLEKLINQ